MAWKKGQSGNPKGRPPQPQANTAKERAALHADKAFKALADIVADKKAPHSARVSAASTLLDRAYGRAPQDVTVKGQIESHIIQLIQGLDTLAEQDESKPEQVTEH